MLCAWLPPVDRVVNVAILVNVVCVAASSGNPQRGAADAEIKVPSGENTELKHSSLKAWSRSVI